MKKYKHFLYLLINNLISFRKMSVDWRFIRSIVGHFLRDYRTFFNAGTRATHAFEWSFSSHLKFKSALPSLSTIGTVTPYFKPNYTI